MDTSQFWQLIERSKAESGGDCDRQVEALTSILLALPAKEIEEFDRLFDHFQDQAYRNDLWAAAYIMNGGCSDDGFEYFRSWLIGQGATTYTTALRDPETLVAVCTPHSPADPYFMYECESLAYAPLEAYEQKTGQEMPYTGAGAPELIGEPWEDDDLPAMFPKLWAAFE